MLDALGNQKHFFGSSVLEKLMQTFLPHNDKKEVDTREVQFDLIKEGARIIKDKNT